MLEKVTGVREEKNLGEYTQYITQEVCKENLIVLNSRTCQLLSANGLARD